MLMFKTFGEASWINLKCLHLGFDMTLVLEIDEVVSDSQTIVGNKRSGRWGFEFLSSKLPVAHPGFGFGGVNGTRTGPHELRAAVCFLKRRQI